MMQRCRYGLVWLIFFLASPPAIAVGVTSLHIQPNPATTTDDARVRIDVEGCDSSVGIAQVNHLEREVLISFSGNDYCDDSNPANFITPRFVPVGQLPAGIWRVNYEFCVNAPPPLPPCEIIQSEVLQVGVPPPTNIPVGDRISILIVLALAGSGILLIGRHLQRV